MLLADHGAQVTKIEPPGGDPTRAFSRRAGVAPRQAQRGPRPPRRRRPRPARSRSRRTPTCSSRASRPASPPRLGIDYDTLHAINPRLVYCSITAYGDDGAHADRPGYDALVAARTGHQWESRGVARRHARPPRRRRSLRSPTSSCPTTAGSPRHAPGPLFSGVPWVSMASAYLATLAISAALRVREQTGRGQHVETSLLQGVLATTLSAWQRVEHVDAPQLPELDQRPARAEGRVPVRRRPVDPPVGAAPRRSCSAWPRATASQRTEKTTPPRDATDAHRHGRQRDAAAPPLPTRSWRGASPSSRPTSGSRSAPRSACRCSRCARPRRRCSTTLFVADGCVIEVDDPELGPVRQVGRVYELHAVPDRRARARRSHPARTPTTVQAEADAAADAPRRRRRAPTRGAVVAARRRPRARPRARGRRTVGHDDARRPRRRRHQGQPAARLLLDEHAHRDGVQPRQAQHRDQPQGPDGDGRSCTSWSRPPTSCSTTCATTRPCASVSTTSRCETIKPDLIYCHTRGFEHGARELPARQRPDRRRARGPRLARRRARPRRHPALAGHLARRHRQRVPVGHRHGAGAVPPRPHR